MSIIYWSRRVPGTKNAYYMYPDCELKTFISPIVEFLKNTKIVSLFFNNHAKAQAVVNAGKKKYQKFSLSNLKSNQFLELDLGGG